MRTFELLLFLTLLAYLLLPPRPRRWAAAAAVLVALFHLGLEGERWQMVPAYLLTALSAALTLVQFLPRPAAPTATRSTPDGSPLQEGSLAGQGRPRAGSVAGRPRSAALGHSSFVRFFAGPVLILLLALPPILFPVPRLPLPGGPYAVGTLTMQWTDPTRPEPSTPTPGDNRTIMVQVWYPAVPDANARPGPWMDRLDVAGPTMATFLRLPSFFLDHAELLKTHSYPAAPAATGGPFPVVIYSHGWNGFRTINLDQSEALASHGYVAVAVDHTFGAMVTVFADGSVALNNSDLLPEREEASFPAASAALEALYAADLSFALDTLTAVANGPKAGPLAGLPDFERVGFYGHSTGGGAVVITCAQDARCDAGLGQDAWLEPVPDDLIGAGVVQPFLFLRSEVWASGPNDARLAQLRAASAAETYRLTILGTRHYDFTMLPLLSPLAPLLGLKGPLAGPRVLEINSDYLVGFFDQYLKGQPSALLAGPSEAFPEVRWEN
jgi:predicted dienelactone hydrolase